MFFRPGGRHCEYWASSAPQLPGQLRQLPQIGLLCRSMCTNAAVRGWWSLEKGHEILLRHVSGLVAEATTRKPADGPLTLLPDHAQSGPEADLVASEISA